jgi:hypothetical protein
MLPLLAAIQLVLVNTSSSRVRLAPRDGVGSAFDIFQQVSDKCATVDKFPTLAKTDRNNRDDAHLSGGVCSRIAALWC